MKRILLFSSFLVMLLFTACQKEVPESNEVITHQMLMDQLEIDLEASGLLETFDMESWHKEFIENLPSEAEILSELEISQGETEIRSSWVCDNIEPIRRLSNHRGFLTGGDIITGQNVISLYSENGFDVYLSDFPSSWISTGFAQEISGVASPHDVFNSSDLSYAQYEILHNYWNCPF